MDEAELIEELGYLLGGETIGGEVLATISSPDVEDKFLLWVGEGKCFEITVKEVTE